MATNETVIAEHPPADGRDWDGTSQVFMMQNESARFFAKIHKDSSTGCWEWLGAKSGSGYGKFSFRGRRGVPRDAHRVAFAAFVGAIPLGIFVLHSCDNRICVNPGHLFLGTRDDNAKDMTTKGRQAQCERHGRSKLTDMQVVAVRQLLSGGTPRKLVAKMFEVHRVTIDRIAGKKNWRSLNDC